MKVLLIHDWHSRGSRVVNMLGQIPDIEIVIQTDKAGNALQLIAEHSPALLIIGANSLGDNCLNSIPEIKKEFPEIKVFVITGSKDDDMTLKARAAGADIVARNNLTLDGLIQLIRYSQKNYRVYPSNPPEAP